MRVTLFGATGLLGKALTQEWTGIALTGLSSRDADIRNAEEVALKIREYTPDWVVLAAAYTDVDGCQTNRDLAFAVNRDGAINVARAAKRAGAKLMFLSSDYVFDGKKTTSYETADPRNPQSVYGKSKAEAELALLDIMPECCIVRTSWLYGMGGKCFPDTILKLAATRRALDVVNDQRGSPTYVVDLARAIAQLCEKNANGIIHVTNSGNCTWFDLAREIIGTANLPTIVRPVSSEQFVRPAPRPAYSVLSPESLRNLHIEIPTWQDALSRYLKLRLS